MSSQQESGSTEEMMISLSTSFYPGTPSLPRPQDIVFVSNDKVFFYVHPTVLLEESSNEFGGLLTPDFLAGSQGPNQCKLAVVAESSSVFNLILHAFYGLRCTHFNPPAADVLTAISTLEKYGASLSRLLGLHTPLLEVATTCLPSVPAEFYALAGKYDLYDLAARASAHLLAVEIQDLPASAVTIMGPVYLKRLLVLQLGRLDLLKDLLAEPPQLHAATPQCGPKDQATLAQAWQLVGAYFIWEMRPELTPISLEVTFRQLRSEIVCPLCVASFDTRLAKLLEDWSAAKRTI